MKKILKVDNPNDYAQFVDAPVLHPLLSIIHYDELEPFRHSLNNYGVYGLFIQRQFPHNLSYGMRKLQVSDASIIAVEPGQIGGLEDNGERITLSGWVLLWSPELLHGSELEHQIDRYQFFSYFFTETLRMEPDEWLCITQLVIQMRQEVQTHDDSPSLSSVLLGYLHLILGNTATAFICVRFRKTTKTATTCSNAFTTCCRPISAKTANCRKACLPLLGAPPS